MTVSFTVPGTPIPQGSKKVVRGRLIDDNAAKLEEWRGIVAAEAGIAMRETMSGPLTGPVELIASFYFKRPKNHHVAGDRNRPVRPGSPRHVPTRPDLDKLIRAVCDALTSVVFNDDCQVVGVSARKLYVHPMVPRPCARILVTPL